MNLCVLSRTVLAPIAASFALAGSLTTTASAQGADWVLFGKPDPGAFSAPDYRRTIVSPLTSPVYHEDSYISNDLRGWFLRQSLPNPRAGGGNVTSAMVQARVALASDVQLLVYRNGFINFNSPLADGNSGNLDLAVGLKWAYVQDWEQDFHAAAGIGYEFGTGDSKVAQGDEEVRIWGSINQGIGRFHLGATANFAFALGNEDAVGDSDRLFLHAHSDYYFNDRFSGVLEFNFYETFNEGQNKPLAFTGMDLANLGGGEAESVLTVGWGGEVRASKSLSLRLANELPLSTNDDIFNNRWTFSAVWSF